jgi:hypothetical protein
MYSGAGNVMQTMYGEPNVSLTYAGGGLDRFGRVTNHAWMKGNNPLVHILHGYDYAGNRLYRNDVLSPNISELYPLAEFFRVIEFGRCVLGHVMLVENPLDLVDDSRSLRYQMLSKVGQLPNLGVLRIGGENATNAVGPLTASEPVSVVPKEFTEGIGVTFISFMHGGVVGLNDDDFGTMGLLQFFEEPVVESTNFDDGHVASMFSSFFDEGGEKLINIVTIGTDLTFLNDIASFVSDIDSQLALVLVDSKVQHGGLRGVKLWLKIDFTSRETSMRFFALTTGGLLSEYHSHWRTSVLSGVTMIWSLEIFKINR